MPRIDRVLDWDKIRLERILTSIFVINIHTRSEGIVLHHRLVIRRRRLIFLIALNGLHRHALHLVSMYYTIISESSGDNVESITGRSSDCFLSSILVLCFLANCVEKQWWDFSILEYIEYNLGVIYLKYDSANIHVQVVLFGISSDNFFLSFRHQFTFPHLENTLPAPLERTPE